MTSPPVVDIDQGPFLCHAHLLGDVNNPLAARCTVWHPDQDTAWNCRTRYVKENRDGTRLHWSTCRLNYCRYSKIGRL